MLNHRDNGAMLRRFFGTITRAIPPAHLLEHCLVRRSGVAPFAVRLCNSYMIRYVFSVVVHSLTSERNIVLELFRPAALALAGSILRGPAALLPGVLSAE